MPQDRPSPRGRSLTRKERAKKRAQLSQTRAAKGMGPLKLRKTVAGVTYERVETSGGFITGKPQVKTFKIVDGKRTRVPNDEVEF